MSRLATLDRQITATQAEMTALEDAAAADGRDLTDAEQATYDELCNRAATLAGHVKTATSGRMALLEAQAQLVAVNATVPGLNRSTSADAPELTAGEYLSAWIAAFHPDYRDTATFVNRAARYLDRAQQLTADTAGLLPEPIVGEVVKLADARRPAFNALAHPAMPIKGKKFGRPVITQRTQVGTQTEGQALASRKMTVGLEDVTKATYGGTLELSLQELEWTEPDALQLVVTDFVDTYTEYTEAQALAFLAGLVTAGDTAIDGQTYSPWVTTNIGTRIDSIVDGVLSVYGRSKRLPDTFLVDLATWGELAGTVNPTTDTTALTLIKAALSDAGFDLNFVVSPAAPANTRLIFSSSLTEGYERQRGLLRGEKVSTLTAEVAYSGDVAFWGKHEAIVSLATDPT